MAGFLPDIPKHLFEGIDIWTVIVGSASVTFDLKDGKRIMLQPYGVTEDRGEQARFPADKVKPGYRR